MKFHSFAANQQTPNSPLDTAFMKRVFHSTLFAAMAVSMCAGQGPTPAAHRDQPAQTSAVHGAATAGPERWAFAVELAKSLSSKKLKEGDEIDAKVTAEVHTSDGMTIRRGSKVIGHVTEAKARSNGAAESTLGIAFDKITRPGSVDVPIKSVVLAVAPNPNPGPESSAGFGYSLGEATEKNALPTQRGRSVPILNEQSRGVLEIRNLQLGPDDVLISSGKEVKLDSGMQVLLEVTTR